MTFIEHKCPLSSHTKNARSLFDTRTVVILFVPSASELLVGKIQIERSGNYKNLHSATANIIAQRSDSQRLHILRAQRKKQ
jgi:hypothetical protein